MQNGQVIRKSEGMLQSWHEGPKAVGKALNEVGVPQHELGPLQEVLPGIGIIWSFHPLTAVP